MKMVIGAVVAAASLAVAVAATAQTGAPAAGAPTAAAGAHDCSRWPASAYDETSGTCICPQGLWWNLRGDACLPKEHAAGEFCVTVWPGSQPLFTAGGGYRCVCLPPLLWDSQATACRAPMVAGEEDCRREWPGTLPVLSPSGTEFECRCPGGRRWDDNRRNCVDGAPVVSVSRGFFVPDGAPGMPVPPPAGAMPPSEGMRPGEGMHPGDELPPNDAMPRGAAPPGARPPASPPASMPYADPDRPAAGATPPDAREPSGNYAPPSGAAAAPQDGYAAPPASSNPKCDALLGEIRARANAGQADQADALGMKAAIAGCDPKAIADAAKVRKAQ